MILFDSFLVFKRVDYLTDGELRRLLKVAKDHRERDWLMILVAYHHGLRASEVVQLTADNIQDGYLRVKRLKGRKKPRRTTHALRRHPDPLLDERQAMFDLLRKSKRGERLFPVRREQFWKIMRKYGAAAGLPRHKCHPHALKHTIGTQLYEKIGIKALQEYFGHKSIQSTAVYLEADEEHVDKAAAEAIGAAKPR